MRRFLTAFSLVATLLAPAAARASECFQLAQAAQPLFHKAAVTLETEQVLIRYIAHSSYLIENAEGLQIITDWSGDFEHKLERQPDVITMNHAHETHWTAFPDEEIEHALKGWGEKGKPRRHFLRLGETLIRNVPTDIRGYGSGEPFGNSIFLFEVGDLCIGHLGHIHHIPTEEQFALLGRLDVVMVPVDGTWTLGIDELLPLLKRLRAQVVLPMHAFGRYTLNEFLSGMKDSFAVKYLDENEFILSGKTLPESPTVFVPSGL